MEQDDMKQNGMEQNHTGTDTREDKESTDVWDNRQPLKFKQTLQPLVSQITKILYAQGEISRNDLAALKALAAINHISELLLNELIAQIIQQQSVKSASLAAFIQWNKVVNSTLIEKGGKLSSAEIKHLVIAGITSIDKNTKQLSALIKEKQRLFAGVNTPPLVGDKLSFTNFLSLNNKFTRLLLIASVVVVFLLLIPNKQPPTLTPPLAFTGTTETAETTEQQAVKQSLELLAYTKKQQEINTKTIQFENIKQAQMLLNNLSYQVKENGLLDKATNNAINNFLQAEQLPAALYSGEVYDALLTQLEQAYDRNDNRAWEIATNIGTTSAYQTYLGTYQQGQYSKEAQQLITAIVNAEQQAKQQRENAKQQQQNNIAQQAIEQLLNSVKSIPAGTFTMGCADDVCKNNEKPAHTVTVKAFSMMSTEVTFAMWNACIIKKGCSYKPDDLGWGLKKYPVINVSYHDIINEFIPWLNQLTGEQYSLPSEAQWEYAANAVATDLSCLSARYGQFSGECGNQRSTIAVKSFSANNFALYDLQGNVSEWVQDCWNDSYVGAPVNGSVWLSGQCDGAVLRGGSWLNTINALRTTARRAQLKSYRSNDIGFRLVLNK